MITSRGPGGSLTLIIVDMKDHRRSHERKYPVTPLSNPPNNHQNSSQHPFVPAVSTSSRLSASTFSALLKCRPWTFDFDPVQSSPRKPYVHKEVIIECLFLISIYSDILHTVYDAEGSRFIDGPSAGGPLPPILHTLSELHI